MKKTKNKPTVSYTIREQECVEPKDIYISGPITGVKDYNEANFKKAEKWIRLQTDGLFTIFNPINSFNGDKTLDWRTYMRYDISRLMTCKEAYFLHDWQTSKGAALEHSLCLALGIDIYVFDKDITEAIKQPQYNPCDVAFNQEQSPCLEAHKLVNGDRGEAYGHPYDDYFRTASLFKLLTGVHLSVEQAVKFMICVKLSRMSHKHKQDNLTDICGYVECLSKVIDRQKGIDGWIENWLNEIQPVSTVEVDSED